MRLGFNIWILGGNKHSAPVLSELVSWDCCNVLPWTAWYKKIKKCSLIVLSPKSVSNLSQNQSILRALLPPNVLGENPFPSFFKLLVATGIPWLMTTSLQSLPPWFHCLIIFCLKNSLCPSLTRIDMTALGAYPDNPRKRFKILNFFCYTRKCSLFYHIKWQEYTNILVICRKWDPYIYFFPLLHLRQMS